MKPLGRKAYGSIPHLPNSRLGPADHHCSPGQAVIATENARDKHDVIIVQEKLDGSNCCVAKIDGSILALTRAGYLATTSPYEQHFRFEEYVRENEYRFDRLLSEGERVCGEWLHTPHGTQYKLRHELFVPFDIMVEADRKGFVETTTRCQQLGFPKPAMLSFGPPISVNDALFLLGEFGHHGAQDPAEGLIYRVERKGEVDFLCKYVRPEKVDGKYLTKKEDSI